MTFCHHDLMFLFKIHVYLRLISTTFLDTGEQQAMHFIIQILNP